MIRRLAPTLALLALGFAALVTGLSGLHRIFSQERDDARAELAARRQALEQYALEALKHELHARWLAAQQATEAAARDPLADDRGLYLREQGEQRLPRLHRATEGQGQAARELFESLPGREGEGELDDPFRERVALVRRFHLSLEGKDRREIEQAFRAILAHRTRFVVAAPKDVPLMLALLERFVERSSPQPALLRGLLRDGVPGIEAEGLERQLLRRRDRFSARDFAFLCGRLTALARRVGVPVEDFQARCAQPSGEPLTLPARLPGPSLLGAGWYLEPAGGETVRGLAVDVGELLSAVRAEMRERGLLAADDQVHEPAASFRATGGEPSPGGMALRPLSALRLAVESPAWSLAEARHSSRHRLKSAVLFVCGVLALGIVLLAAVAQHRKHRFLELRSDFISTVSHELRTPLASVRVMAETLEKRVAATRGARDYPARIIREVDSLGFLVENILSFNRLDKNRWVARKEPVALGELFAFFTEVATCTRARVALSTEGLEEVTLHADRELMKMLFANLIRNACKHHAREEVRITLSAEPRGAGWVVRVADNGVGIPPDQFERIFKEFYRLPESQGRGGSGLGLAICRRIMEVHRGAIRVASSSPEGTTFELEFPGSAA